MTKKMTLRLPDALHDALAVDARHHGRSLHSEILYRLQTAPQTDIYSSINRHRPGERVVLRSEDGATTLVLNPDPNETIPRFTRWYIDNELIHPDTQKLENNAEETSV